MLPPCHNLLTQHSMRASSQTYIWRRCFNPIIDADEPVNCGWLMNDDILNVQWMTCNPAPDEFLTNLKNTLNQRFAVSNKQTNNSLIYNYFTL